MTEQGRNAFSFTSSESVVVTPRPGELDFKIYDLSIDGQAVVGIYAGNFADFPPLDEQGLHQAGSPERFRPAGSQRTEYLWRTGYDWPSEIHVWPMPGLEGARAAQAQALADSVRPTLKASRSGD